MHDEAQSEIRELESLRSQANIWRWGLTLVFGVVTLGSALVMWNAVTGLTQDGPSKAKFVSYLSSDMQGSILPTVQQLGTDALHNINFGAEIAKVNKRTPEVANATIGQFKALADDLPKRSEMTIDTEFDSVMKDHEARLKTAFPEATDEQLASVAAAMTSEAHDQVTGIAGDLFSPHIKSLNSIVADLNTIEAKEGPSVKTETPTWQMAFMVSDIARADFANLQKQNDAAKSGK